MKQEYINLYDDYTHSKDMSRRDFIDRLAKLEGEKHSIFSRKSF